MKIIRWLFSHLFLILLIVVVIYGYMFWGNLAGEKTPAGKVIAYLSSEFVEVEEFVNAVKAKQAQLSAEQSPSEKTVDEQPETLAEDQLDNQLVDTNDVPPGVPSAGNKALAVAKNIVQQPVSISYSHNQMRVRQNSDGEIESQPDIPAQTETAAVDSQPEAQSEAVAEIEPVPAFESEPDAEPVAVVKEDLEPATESDASSQIETPSDAVPAVAATNKFVSEKVEKQLSNVDKNGQVINPALKGHAIRASWITARKSFYQRKYELSEQSYRDVINNTSDNFDAYGELGNVYFNQGKNSEAAAAYFEAASILVRQGQVSRARSLMGLLRHLDDSKAQALQKLIDSAAS